MREDNGLCGQHVFAKPQAYHFERHRGPQRPGSTWMNEWIIIIISIFVKRYKVVTSGAYSLPFFFDSLWRTKIPQKSVIGCRRLGCRTKRRRSWDVPTQSLTSWRLQRWCLGQPLASESLSQPPSDHRPVQDSIETSAPQSSNNRCHETQEKVIIKVCQKFLFPTAYSEIKKKKIMYRLCI